ncbi:MAG: hypothetical protein IKK99_01910 [Oscillospiraceae bacterium]|nr:hypothetical protein [Oscillospiraceae bacterium]
MFQTKKKKIQTYLIKKSSEQFTSFDELLEDYLSGKMKETFSALGAKKVEIHIDWLPDYRCIGVQGTFNHNYLDLQIEPTEFSVGYDPVEPDNHIYYPLENKDQVYAIVKQIFEIRPDVEVKFEFNMTRKAPVKSGYRPHHLVKDDYMTTGVHQYFNMDQVAPGETAYGTITFITPESYPHCLYKGKIIQISEGERIVGYATVIKVLNPLLDSKN